MFMKTQKFCAVRQATGEECGFVLKVSVETVSLALAKMLEPMKY